MKKLILPVLLLGVGLPSCVYRLGDFTFISSKNVDMNNSQGFSTIPNMRARGKDTMHIVVVIPTGNCSPKEAMDKAIEKNGVNCVGLSNAKIEHGFWYIPYVYGQEWYAVEGDPVFKK